MFTPSGAMHRNDSALPAGNDVSAEQTVFKSQFSASESLCHA
jgi:hypothetical protein